MDDSTNYYLLKAIEADPGLSQRDLAHKLGISLGKANYCLRALIERGLVKAENWRRSPNKAGYLYMLTPKGLEEKTRVAFRFLKAKQQEYEQLKVEIEQLQGEVGRQLLDKE